MAEGRRGAWTAFVDLWDRPGDDPVLTAILFFICLCFQALLSGLLGGVLFIVWAPLCLAWAWPLWRALERRERPRSALVLKALAIAMNLLYGACWGALSSGYWRIAG